MYNPLRDLAEYLDERGIEYTHSMGGGLRFVREDGTVFLVGNSFGELSIYQKCRSVKEVIVEVFSEEGVRMPKDARGVEINVGDLTVEGVVLGFFVDAHGWHAILSTTNGPSPICEPSELHVVRSATKK